MFEIISKWLLVGGRKTEPVSIIILFVVDYKFYIGANLFILGCHLWTSFLELRVYPYHVLYFYSLSKNTTKETRDYQMIWLLHSYSLVCSEHVTSYLIFSAGLQNPPLPWNINITWKQNTKHLLAVLQTIYFIAFLCKPVRYRNMFSMSYFKVDICFML